MLTGRISTWDRQKGFGYVEADGRSHFLHHREFTERHKTPEVGDIVTFQLGADQKGRTCAVQARHANDGGRVKFGHVILLAVLLIAPAVASVQLGRRDGWWFIAIWQVLASALTWYVYWDDKRRARSGAWRTAESFLHLLELLGGWPGAFLAQRQLRHKVSKAGFQVMFWLIIALHHYIAIDFLNDWHLTRAAIRSIFNS